MKDFQQRVVIEKTELDEKIGKLTKFLQSPSISVPDAERDRLFRQLGAMNAYSFVLGERIANFEV